MPTRRSLLLLPFFALTAAGPARAESLIFRFGRWYRITDPDTLPPSDEGDDDDDPRQIERRPLDPLESQSRADAEGTPRDAVDESRVSAARGEDERVARGSRSPIARTTVRFDGYAPGSIVVSTGRKRLFLVLDDGSSALCYGVGVGREGFSWKGTEKISAKRAWPDWYPPAEMIAREPKLPPRVEGGLGNPLGARALYLGETLYRIHGTNQPASIGHSASSGCFRMANPDIIDLYDRVGVGTPVTVI
jgi:lipoprotein-anchoring transpeptidase ErfK/SrfK